MIGGIFGFLVYAVLSINNSKRDKNNPHHTEKIKEITMPETNNLDAELYWLIGVVAAFFLILMLAGLAQFTHDFSRELRYLNNEIRRTTDAERLHYIRQRRRLWLSLIPFVRY